MQGIILIVWGLRVSRHTAPTLCNPYEQGERYHVHLSMIWYDAFSDKGGGSPLTRTPYLIPNFTQFIDLLCMSFDTKSVS